MKCLTVDISKNNAAETNGFSNIAFCKCCRTIGFNNIIFDNVVNTNGFNNFSKAETTTKTTEPNVVKTIDCTTFPNTMLLEPLIFQHFRKQCC